MLAVLQALLLVLSTTPQESFAICPRRQAPVTRLVCGGARTGASSARLLPDSHAGCGAGPGYPGEKGQGKAGGSIEEEGVDAFVSGSQRQR